MVASHALTLFFFFLFFFSFISLAEARPDDPFRPSDQDRVHFGTPAFIPNALNIAHELRGGKKNFELVGPDEHQVVSRVPWLTILNPKTQIRCVLMWSWGKENLNKKYMPLPSHENLNVMLNCQIWLRHDRSYKILRRVLVMVLCGKRKFVGF